MRQVCRGNPLGCPTVVGICLANALFGLLLIAAGASRGAAEPGGTKTLSGKLRSVKGNVLTIEKKGLANSSLVEIEMEKKTKVTGQLVPGMHVKVKYREESDSEGSRATPGASAQVLRIAVEIEARPEHASKAAREAAKESKP